jgi:hypothetical protein
VIRLLDCIRDESAKAKRAAARPTERAAEPSTAEASTESQNLLPTHLASWREILITLGMHHNDEDKQKVSRLNKTYSGPITTPGQGKQPFVEKAKLLEWWRGLEAKALESQQRQRDAQATVSARHGYGRKGEVAPGIAGGVKKRRRDRKP